MKLREYTSLEAKKENFEQRVINTPSEFDEWFEGLTIKNKEFIYRGVCEAKYMNYTSAQRDWITKECSTVLGLSYVDYIDKLITQIRNEPLLKNNFESLGISINDILYLSFMQHYGLPSPLLDFTKDLRIALFFALNGMKYEPSSVEIENYFSIYALPSIMLTQADQFFKSAIERGEKMLEDFVQSHSNENVYVNDDLLKKINLLTKWKKADGSNDGLYCIHLMYIPNPLDALPVISTSGQRLYWSNLNILAQQGCFVMNSSETEPLECIIAQKEYIPNIKCVDIHKSLADYIRSKYVSHLNEDVIYPEFKKLADKAIEEFRKGL